MTQKQEQVYYGQILQSQLSHYQMRLREKMQQTQDPFVVDECAVCLAEIATRLQVIEELLVAEMRMENSKAASSKTSSWSSSKTIQASEMDNIENLYTLEFHSGKALRWSGENRNIEFIIPVTRESKSLLTIDLVAVVKPKFVKTLTIYVDGASCSHKVREVDGYIQLWTRLPVKAEKRPTQVRITLPETLSPSESGAGKDNRKLGIAISSISITPVKSRFAKLVS